MHSTMEKKETEGYNFHTCLGYWDYLGTDKKSCVSCDIGHVCVCELCACVCGEVRGSGKR